MSKKYVLFLVISMLVTGSIGLMESSTRLTANGSPSPQPILPKVCINPSNITGLNVNDTFTVNIMISNLNGSAEVVDERGMTYKLGDLYGFDITLSWNPSILEYISHTVKVPVETYPDGILHSPAYSIKDEVNKSAGAYRCSYASISPAEPFNGNGTIFTITFKVLKKEVTALHFTNLMTHDYKELKCVRLMDSGSIPIPNLIFAGIVGRDVAVSGIEILTPKITQGYNTSVNVTLSNYGGSPENITLELYYNTTEITNWENPAGVEWKLIGKKNVTLEAATYNHKEEKLEMANKTINFTWNTTGMLNGLPEAKFYTMANITILSAETNLKNNQLLGETPIEVSSVLYRDLTVTDFEAIVSDKFSPPAISGEPVNLSFNILNDGTVPEENLNVSLSVTGQNYSETKSYNISYLEPGSKHPLEYSWNTTGLEGGDYTIKVQVSEVPNENVTANNIYEKVLTVIVPPSLKIVASKTTNVKVGETVTFNATSSYSNMPGENIQAWQWEWKVYRIDIKDENLVHSYSEGPIMNYTIQEFQNYYRIVLTITDSYNMTYVKDRPTTRPYSTTITLYVQRAEEGAGEEIPLTYIIVGIVIAVIVIAAAAYYLKVRKES